ncbi:MAG: hypothetical protein OXO50_09220 [Caldilineaceae bacterium]|nr:hypothetical protein [Caldilineaceae bacterium]
MKIAKWSALFGLLLLCFLFIFDHINWETGEIYPPFRQRPTPTPIDCDTSSDLDCKLALIDELSMRLWEADGSPEATTQITTQAWYGDVFAANAHGCDMEYVEFFNLIMDTAQRFEEARIHFELPRTRIMNYLRFKEGSCEEHLSDLSKIMDWD